MFREKDEAMAQLLARGFDYTNAHVKAGFQKNTGNAHSKANMPDMVERVAELKEEYGLTEGARKERNEALAGDIDEEWLIEKYRDLHDDAVEAGDYKAAKLCLDEIGKMKTLGDQNVKANLTRGEDLDSRRKQLPTTPAINIHVLADSIRGGGGEVLEEPTDITPDEDRDDETEE